MDAHYACNAVESRLAEIYDKKEQIELNYHILKCKAYSDPGKTCKYSNKITNLYKLYTNYVYMNFSWILVRW